MTGLAMTGCAAIGALLSAVFICGGTAPALGEPYAASGQAGYLQEWELKASLARTVSGGKVEYSGPMTLTHVGLCSVNGPEEKSGQMQVTVSRSTAAIEGTLAMDGDSCRIVASRSQSYSGLLSCRNAGGVPINFSIEAQSAAGLGGPDGRR